MVTDLPSQTAASLICGPVGQSVPSGTGPAPAHALQLEKGVKETAVLALT